MISAALLAQQHMPDPRASWLPVVVMIVIALMFAVGNVVISSVIGPSRTGPGKGAPYESGMMPVGDTRRRFNVRFYIVAMIFLVFDVEIVFFYPWATIFAPFVKADPEGLGRLLLVEMGVFVAILLLAYVYAWGKGVFRWD